MIDSNEILFLLDWNNSQANQQKGLALAKKVKNIQMFIQPTTPLYNKNVWENCAIVLCDRTDTELEPYLLDLIAWGQDLNWPGALRILKRLSCFNNKCVLEQALNKCLGEAIQANDSIWQNNIKSLLQNEHTMFGRDELNEKKY